MTYPNEECGMVSLFSFVLKHLKRLGSSWTRQTFQKYRNAKGLNIKHLKDN